MNEKFPPPETVGSSPESPDKAPFEGVWYMAVLDGFQILWGPQVVLLAIDSPGDLTEYTVDSLDGINATHQLLDDKAELGKALLPSLLGILRDPNQSHHTMASTLGWICQDAQVVVPALIAALQDPDAGTRASAANSLGCFEAEASAAVSALASALGDEDWWVRENAAYSLGRIGPAAISAVPALIQALNDEELLVMDRAVEALRTITDEDLGDNPEIEAFNSHFKTENRPLLLDAQTLEELQALVSERIDYCSNERRHSSIAYQAPVFFIASLCHGCNITIPMG
ncbi:MAG: hypothetical protein A2Z14_16915 [Chloroflexi bacterium RBG_16_48_8]|nr:MAG: hypothetical protein A2Z14_16915 [Chloroflexi bacterium RBG_16_48_8]